MIIDQVLKSVGGNVTLAAEKLGVTRKTIYNKLQVHPDLRVVISSRLEKFLDYSKNVLVRASCR